MKILGEILPSAPAQVKRQHRAAGAFSVSARVAMQLGRESISSSNTAIVELVKNAYDADARKVKLEFVGLDSDDATLVVSDDGHGMTEEELREHWLCIGTTNKQETRRSKRGRVQTGEKGLGRLGLDRLSRRTTLQSRRMLTDDEKQQPDLFPEIEPEAVELDIDWERYQVKGQRLETIAHEISTLEHLDFDPITHQPLNFPNGTRMILRGLKEQWTPSRLDELVDELSLMLSPFANPEDFQIEIDSGLKLRSVDGFIHAPRELLSLSNWKVDAEITPISAQTEDGEPREDVSITVSSAHHPRSYSIDPTPWEDWIRHGVKDNVRVGRLSRCGPVRLIFHFFVITDESSQIRAFMESNRGIRIYRDGFRVKPYGDPSGTNDWLALSLQRARNPAAISRKGWKVAYHQVVGAALISQERNPGLQDQTNREGLSESGAFVDLRAFAQKVVAFFEKCAHEDYLTQNPLKPKEQPSSKADTNPLEQAERDVQSLAIKLAKTPPLNGDDTDEKTAKSVLSALQTARQQLAERDSRHKEEVEILRDDLTMTNILASLGIMAAYFGHERVNDAVSVQQKMAELRRIIRNPHDSLFPDEEAKLEIVNLLEAGVTRLEAFARFALDTVRPWKRSEEPAQLVPMIVHTMESFRETLLRSGVRILPQNMQVEWEDHAHLVVLARRVQWECIFSNLLVNSLWATRSKPRTARAVQIDLTRVDDATVKISFQDSGIGLEANTEADIFRPGFSTKRDHRGRQEGTGLGLSLVKSFVEEAGGSIVAERRGELGGAKFSIYAPLRTQ